MATLYESHTTGTESNRAFYQSSPSYVWLAQTFTPSLTHTITYIKVKLLRFAGSTPGVLTASILATSGGVPAGTLVSGTYADGNSITTSSPGEWIKITLGAGYLLNASSVYALRMKSSTDDPTKPIYWRKISAGGYGGGAFYSTEDGGGTWAGLGSADALFEEWGDGTGTPTVTTQAVTGIVTTSATGNGNVTDLGDSSVTQHGHCWNTTGLPDTDDSKTTNGAKAATGAFTSGLTSLTSGTLYYVRAYATNTDGTEYGDEVSFIAGAVGGELRGLYAVVEERLHYVDAYGVERALLGEPV